MKHVRILAVLGALGASSIACYALALRCFVASAPAKAAAEPAVTTQNALFSSAEIDTVVVKTTSANITVKPSRTASLSAAYPSPKLNLRTERVGRTLNLYADEPESDQFASQAERHGLLRALTPHIRAAATEGIDAWADRLGKIEITLNAPDRLGLHVETISGKVLVDVGSTNSLQVQTTSGDVTLAFDKLTGNVDVDTTSGDIRMNSQDDRLLPIEAHSRSGVVDWGPVDVTDRQRASTSESYRVQLRSTSGDIHIRKK